MGTEQTFNPVENAAASVPLAMNISKSVVVLIVFMCFVNVSWSKPTTEYVTEGRGIASTIWGWITYPFTWWSSSETEQPPVTDQLIASTTYGPNDAVAIGKPNVTVWCNDQTCTTMMCGQHGCRNVTCNIYDTDMNGECREYITTLKPDEYVPPLATETMPPPQYNSTAAPITLIDEQSTTLKNNSQLTEERPLELEAVLSSTVTKVNNYFNNRTGKVVPVTPSRKI